MGTQGCESEADALADGNTKGFNPSCQVESDPSKLPWLVLNTLFKLGVVFHESNKIKRQKLANQSAGTVQLPAGAKLKDTQPW